MSVKGCSSNCLTMFLKALLIVAFLSFVHSHIGKVEIVIEQEFLNCIKYLNTISETLKHIFFCIKLSVSQCLLHWDKQFHPAEKLLRLCGVLNTGGKLKPITRIIDINDIFILNLYFEHFHLPCAETCNKGALDILHTRVLPGGPRHVIGVFLKSRYCGHRRPWGMSSLQTVLLRVDVSDGILEGFYFVVRYYITDKQLPFHFSLIDSLSMSKTY